MQDVEDSVLPGRRDFKSGLKVVLPWIRADSRSVRPVLTMIDQAAFREGA